MSKTKWICDDCGAEFDSRGALVEHLKGEFEEATQVADTCQQQLDDMGENPYE